MEQQLHITMKQTLLQYLTNRILGRKYYLPIYVRKGTFITCTSATPFKTLQAAKESTRGLMAFDLIEIISFRSHENYEGGQLL